MLILNVWQERCYFYHKLMFLHIGQDLEEDKHSTQQTNITFKEIGWTAQIGLTSLARLRHVIKVPCLCLFFFFSQTEMDLENHRCIVSKQKVLLFLCVRNFWCHATHVLRSSNNYFPKAILFDYNCCFILVYNSGPWGNVKYMAHILTLRVAFLSPTSHSLANNPFSRGFGFV